MGVHSDHDCPVCESPLIFVGHNIYNCMGMCDGSIRLDMSSKEIRIRRKLNKILTKRLKKEFKEVGILL